MIYEYEVVEQGQNEQTTHYQGPSLVSALTEYREYGCYSRGPLTLYRTAAGKSEWLCTDGETFLPCTVSEAYNAGTPAHRGNQPHGGRPKMKRTFLNRKSAEWLALAPETTIEGTTWFIRSGCVETYRGHADTVIIECADERVVLYA